MAEENNTTINTWLNNELAELDKDRKQEPLDPILQIPENKLVELEIDFSKEFGKYNDTENNTVKKLVTCTYEGKKHVWFLNTKNPMYRQLLKLGVEGKNKVRIIRTGTAAQTRYNIVE